MRRVRFSLSYTVSLSRTCQCYCKSGGNVAHEAVAEGTGLPSAAVDDLLGVTA